jgi:hypothetical protein
MVPSDLAGVLVLLVPAVAGLTAVKAAVGDDFKHPAASGTGCFGKAIRRFHRAPALSGIVDSVFILLLLSNRPAASPLPLWGNGRHGGAKLCFKIKWRAGQTAPL